MFEDYLEDAYRLSLGARGAKDEREAKRFYRAAIFYSISAIEAFINFVGETLNKSGKAEPFEIAFLIDRKFGIEDDKFEILNQIEFNRLEDKLRFLLKRHVPDYEFSKERSWPTFIEFKKFRDSLVHPHKTEDDTSTKQYDEIIAGGLVSIIEIMDRLCMGIFQRNLRKKITDMTL